ncbi:transcriptional regulator [Chryseobacterium suipulveris]|uniref:Transcriptional regulator n=1 Tax=Chryseobacterium suipulveris TaxID=2929800 RepID=A0ABY4BT17_9FLAO|nr:transcriptional regulator [Chryseobacterium suipulveris]UOE40828.1 transcriptional regulator [Chryseobacterium suipulveris]
MKNGDRVLISPQVTGRPDWIEGTVIQVENNPFVGIVITAKSDDGETFFEKEYLFKKVELCTR